MTKLKAWAWRTFWSAIASAGGGLSGAALFDVGAWKAFLMGATITVWSSVLVFARAQADRLPEVTPPSGP